MKPATKFAGRMQIRVLPIEQLVPAAYNPRRALKPTDKAYRKLERSLREFGLVEPLVWNERTGHVVGGHARLSILKAMGVTEVPVSVVNLGDAREKALNVILNNQEAQGRYDPERLADLLDELEELPELELTGFDPSALTTLRLEPATELPQIEEKRDRVTVSLEMDEATFASVSDRLDALVAEFDLVSHVQRTIA
jgi:ParB-like chromosome segregation protein Spo0J